MHFRARPGMADLIDRTRTLIADPAGTTPVFSDPQVQDALDFRRVERRHVPLRAMPSFISGGSIVYLDYYAEAPNWEADVLLQDLSFHDVTSQADVAEYLVGHWHFPAQPTGIGLRATGKTYDLYGSAADLLDSWAAQVKLDFSFQSIHDRYERNQKFAMLRQLAEEYRQRAQVQSSRMVQTDAAPQFDGGGIVYPSIGGGYYGT